MTLDFWGLVPDAAWESCLFLKMSLAEWPALVDYHHRIPTRPAVQEALRSEGML